MAEKIASRIIDVGIIFRAKAIPKHGRNLRDLCIAETIQAAIATPDPGEARVAFRLHSRHWKRENNPPGGIMDIVHSDGTLWWPFSPWTEDVRSNFYRRRLQHNPPKYIGERELLEILARCDPYYDLLTLRSSQEIGYELHQSGNLFPIRVWQEDNRGQMMALAQRVISQNLMIWNGGAYVRGGQPAYVQYPLRGTSDDSMASIGADRAVDPYAGRLPIDIGRFEFGQVALMHGKFQPAIPLHVADIDAETNQTNEIRDHRIETLMPVLVGFNRAQLRLDAIYRAAARALNATRKRAFADLRERFAEVSAGDPASPRTSSVRWDAIVGFCRVAGAQGMLEDDLADAYECFLDFENSKEASTLDSFDLSSEDNDALAALADRLR